ncbi:hypothetical protein ACFQI7_13670 [Paenibacillus allorhizosphaerae]|uniref:hypothetical protein n=1 Tax=Paenibacillus allorhizosphaerae TaxID=2849866 RepID=UPI001C406766|nr:hypothetical protein [Paenibacillus allorhizosphaerae]
MKHIIVIAIVLVFIVSGIIISPWVTVSFAEHQAVTTFEGQWKNVQDGCGFNCKDCGVKASEKVLFGRKVIIEYACGLLPSDSPEYHKRKELFVSFLGTVH